MEINVVCFFDPGYTIHMQLHLFRIFQTTFVLEQIFLYTNIGKLCSLFFSSVSSHCFIGHRTTIQVKIGEFTSSIVCRKHIMANVKFTITFHMNFKRICRNNSRFIVRSKNLRYCSIIFELSIRNIFVHLKLLKF